MLTALILLSMFTCPGEIIQKRISIFKKNNGCNDYCIEAEQEIEYYCSHGSKTWKTYYKIKELVSNIENSQKNVTI